MSISFNSIPALVRTPGQYIEFDNSRAVKGTPARPKKALLIGQKLAAGTATALTPIVVGSPAAAETLFGRGSHLAAMAAAFKAANRYTELWAIPVDDVGAGTQGTKTLTVTGPATAAGVIHLYIAGRHIQVPVALNDAANAIATAINAAIGLVTDLPMTAGTVPPAVTLTSRHKGTLGNLVDVRLNYGQGEALPAGVGVAIATGVTGITDPALTSAIAAMADVQYDTIATSLADDSNLDLLEAELLTRWGPMVMREGHAFVAAGGTLGEVTALGNARNSQFTTLMGCGKSPTPPWVWAAVVAAIDEAEPDPARPRQTLLLPGLLPPPPADQWDRGERDTLLTDGVSTFTVDPAGECRIERLITTYQTNPAGIPDPSYLDVTTMRTLAYLRYSLRTRIALRFPRHKLASDGTRFGPGQAIVTPSAIKAEILVLFGEWEKEGLVEGWAQFESDLLVERNANDPNRIDALLGPDLINAFIVFAGQVQFLV